MGNMRGPHNCFHKEILFLFAEQEWKQRIRIIHCILQEKLLVLLVTWERAALISDLYKRFGKK